MSAITLLVACAAPGMPTLAFEPESDQPIKLMVTDWTSMYINTEILNIIISTYGYHVEIIAGENSARYPHFKAGDFAITMDT